MITATDSFLTYLSTRLVDVTPVAWLHVTSTQPDSGVLKMDTLNVSMLAFDHDGSIESILVSLDLLGSDERTTLRIAKQVRDVLAERQYTPEYDYEADVTPTSLSRMVEWDGNDILFSPIVSKPNWYHLNATFNIRHVWK